MTFLDRLNDLAHRLSSYALWEVALELALIWVAVYAIMRFVQGTRAARALKGVIVLLALGTVLVRVLGDDSFQRLGYLYDRVLAIIAIALIVIFQPELRRGLIRLGETRLFRGGTEGGTKVAAEIAPACIYLAKSRFGAIIVIERTVGLKTLTEGGTEINADLSAGLLQTIFYPGSALHDLAVVIRADKLQSAGVQLPMADASDMTDPRFGSRHRAAIGVTKESDALVVLVSEETGKIRLAERGRLTDPIAPEDLERELVERIGAPIEPESESDGFEDGTAPVADAEPKPKSESPSETAAEKAEDQA